MAALMVAVYPSVRDNPALNKMVESYPEALKASSAFGGNVDYASGAGYLSSELFSFMVPLLLLVAAIGAGARATAGEEERGTLDLLLANPISRRRLVLEKLAALAAELVSSRSCSGWRCRRRRGRRYGRLGRAPGRRDRWRGLFAFAFGAIASLAGRAAGHRGVAIGVRRRAVAAYLVNWLADARRLPRTAPEGARPSTTTSRPTRCTTGCRRHTALFLLGARGASRRPLAVLALRAPGPRRLTPRGAVHQ